MAYLTIRRPGTHTSRIEVQPGAIIGRAHECDVQIGDAQLSRLHCRLDHENGQWMLVDLNSRNGTFIDGQKVDKRPIADGQSFEIGGTRITFHDGPLLQRPANPLEADLTAAGNEGISEQAHESIGGTRYATHATPVEAGSTDETRLSAPRPQATPQLLDGQKLPVQRRRIAWWKLLILLLAAAAMIYLWVRLLIK